MIKVGEWTVYHNGDFCGDATICPPDSMQVEPLNVPMEVLRAVVAAELRSKIISYCESALDEEFLHKLSGF